MKINREIVSLAAQPSPERKVAEQAAQPAGARRDDHLVEMRVVDDDRRSGGLDDVGEVRIREPLPQRMDSRRGEDDVTNLSQADEQNLDAAIPRWSLRRSA